MFTDVGFLHRGSAYSLAFFYFTLIFNLLTFNSKYI
jgi:hypothetical protein